MDFWSGSIRKWHIRPKCFELRNELQPSLVGTHFDGLVRELQEVLQVVTSGSMNHQVSKSKRRRSKSERKIDTFSMKNMNFPKTKWRPKEELKCLVDHTTLITQVSGQWFFDNGCLRHMTIDRFIFVSFENCCKGLVTFGDESKSRVFGNGSVEAPSIMRLEGVHYVDGLKENLINISQIYDDKYNV